MDPLPTRWPSAVRHLSLLAITATILAASGALCRGDSEAFAAAREKLEAGETDAARDGFQAIVDSGKFAPELFFALGNSHYRLGDLGAAALAYRRALFLEPAYKEARQNLAFLETQTAFVDTASPEVPGYVSNTPRKFIAPGLAGGILVAAAAAAAIIGIRRRSRWVTTLCIALIVIGCTASIGLAIVAHGRGSARPPAESAVVVAADTVARTAPAARASEIVGLPVGSVVRVEATRGVWSYVDLSDQLRGWVHADALETLWPFDPGFAE